MMGAVATEPPKFPGEGYVLDTSSTEPGMCGSVFNSDQQMKSRTEALPACTSENSSIISSNNETQEKRCEKSLSTLPASSVESTHRGLDGEILSQLQEDGQKPNVTENHSNSCQSRRDIEHTEADTSCSSSDPGDSVHLMEISTTATLRGNSAGIEGDNSESHLDFTEAPSALKHEDQVTMSEGDADPTLKVVSAELNKPSVDAFLHCPLVSNTWDSLDSNEMVASPKANEAILRENVFDQASEPLGPDTRRGTSHSLSFADFPEHTLPTQETSTTVVVTTDLDRWQRFDAEESEASGTLSMSNRLEGFNQSVNGAPPKRLELWEQLLEDGLEVSTQCLPVSTAPEEAEVGIDSSLFDGNQYWLASPGNPFIEGLERSSNFSEADSFVTNVNLVRSHSLHDYEVDAFPSSKDRLIQGDNIGKQKIPGWAAMVLLSNICTKRRWEAEKRRWKDGAGKTLALADGIAWAAESSCRWLNVKNVGLAGLYI